jgi:hypothetical protein
VNTVLVALKVYQVTKANSVPRVMQAQMALQATKVNSVHSVLLDVQM